MLRPASRLVSANIYFNDVSINNSTTLYGSFGTPRFPFFSSQLPGSQPDTKEATYLNSSQLHLQVIYFSFVLIEVILIIYLTFILIW